MATEKPITLILSPAEGEHLMQCFDVCLRQGGLKSAPAVMNLFHKLSAAVEDARAERPDSPPAASGEGSATAEPWESPDGLK